MKFDLLKRFFQFQQQAAFQQADSHLYWCLVGLFNDKGQQKVWPESVQLTDGALANLAGTNVKTADASRKRLAERGLIEVESFGKGSRDGRVYRLVFDESTSPKTSPKIGDDTGEVSTTSPKNGEVVGEVTPPPLQQPLQQPTQKTETLPIYNEYQTPDTKLLPVLDLSLKADASSKKKEDLDAEKKQELPPPPTPAPVRIDPFLKKSAAESLNVPFSRWWPLYQKAVGETRCRTLWLELTDQERVTALEHTPRYVVETPEKQFRKDPKNYLEEKTFNDEIIPKAHGKPNSQNSAPGRLEPVQNRSFGNWTGSRFGRSAESDERQAG